MGTETTKKTAAEQLGRDLLVGECTAGHKDDDGKPIPCCEAERQRPLTAAEKRATSGTRRPFDRFDAARMCTGCAAYYFATRAEGELRALVHAERVLAATSKRVEA
jgi:hypothetical protein